MAEVYEIKGDEGIVLEVLGADVELAGEPQAVPEPTAGGPEPVVTPQAALSIASRASWGARYPDGDLTLTGLAVEVFVHHSVTAQLSADASIAAEAEQMRALESVGQSRFGTGISYNVVIFPSGRAYQGVSWNRRGTHTGGRNSTSRSICFAGNYETNQPTAAQISTAAAIYREGKQRWWTQAAPLYGHRDVSQTACPGRNLYARIDDIRTDTEEFLMALTDEQQRTLLANSGETATRTEQLITKVDRLEADEAARREAQRRHEATSAARERAMLATIETLSQSVGVDPEVVMARLDEKLSTLDDD
ncbi:peptidoglycan recognition protein family protein [Promicromonospora panici]|uniref:peptidoglycan recognition protein family protein n=1 Tax=Promicromonospora panici TaxID=2219658 RepID=UPI00101D7C20|nr:peptidoglycan recognition family protein [Promicromonospora panici]